MTSKTHEASERRHRPALKGSRVVRCCVLCLFAARLSRFALIERDQLQHSQRRNESGRASPSFFAVSQRKGGRDAFFGARWFYLGRIDEERAQIRRRGRSLEELGVRSSFEGRDERRRLLPRG